MVAAPSLHWPVRPTPSHRRLQPSASSVQRLCGDRVRAAYLQTTLLDAELHFGHFDAAAKDGLWDGQPLLGSPRPGAVRLRCALDELQLLRNAYSGLTLEPLVRAVRPHNGRRPFAPAAAGTALLVLPDYANLFHQFGSLVIAWAAYQDSMRVAPPASANTSEHEPLTLVMLNNATLTPTLLFWSPGLASRPPRFVRASSSPPPPATYRRVVLAQPATETWWWTVWKPEHSDRRATLTPLVLRLASRLLPAGTEEASRALDVAQALVSASNSSLRSLRSLRSLSGAEAEAEEAEAEAEAEEAGARVALVVRRPTTTDRRILNDEELTSELAAPMARAGLRVRLVDLGALPTRVQLALIRRTALLVGAHGAGLLWNLFLPAGAAVLELLNGANANEYYANHCRWMRRPYAAWQNTDPAREERALDPLTREAVDPFRSHMRVAVREVVEVATRLVARAQTSPSI